MYNIQLPSQAIVFAFALALAIMSGYAYAAPPEQETDSSHLAQQTPIRASWARELDSRNRTFDIGFNSRTDKRDVEGKSDYFVFFASLDMERELKSPHIISFQADYHYAIRSKTVQENRCYLLGRFERQLSREPLTWFYDGTVEYDDFKDWDARIALATGFGRIPIFIRESTTLSGRIGAGVSHEISGLDDSWTPEGVLGFDGEFEINQKHAILAKVDYFPNLDGFHECRMNTEISWAILVEEENNVRGKITVFDRLDSNAAPGVKKNDLSFALSAGWDF